MLYASGIVASGCYRYIANLSRSGDSNVMHVKRLGESVICVFPIPCGRHQILVTIEAKHRIEFKAL